MAGLKNSIHNVADETTSHALVCSKVKACSAKPKLVIFMVGLPARGKSYISRKLARYLNWLQFPTRVFNAGEVRRLNRASGLPHHSAEFFDPLNTRAVAQREAIALRTLELLLDWLQGDAACVGILDATNSTIERRTAMVEIVRRDPQSRYYDILFLESSCTDSEILRKNVLLKLSGPDYHDQDPTAALTDFGERIKLYEGKYVPVGVDSREVELPFIKVINVGHQVIVNRIRGLLSATAAEYLLNFRLHDRQIWITRNGESIDDVCGIIGRSSPLSSDGRRFANALNNFIWTQQQIWHDLHGRPVKSDLSSCAQQELQWEQPHRRFNIWTSTMTQARQTAQSFSNDAYDISQLRQLDDLHAGDMAGLTFEEIRSRYTDEMTKRRRNPVHYRWPGLGGESYADVVGRVRPIINELERSEDHALLITHRAVARVLLAYFHELDWAGIADIDVPPGRVFSVQVRPYGVAVDHYQYNTLTDSFDRLNST